MSVAEAIIEGIFDLLGTLLYFGLLVFILAAGRNWFAKIFSGEWGRPTGSLFFLDPRRIWCRHRIAWVGPGTHGLWAVWCDACGKKVTGR